MFVQPISDQFFDNQPFRSVFGFQKNQPIRTHKSSYNTTQHPIACIIAYDMRFFSKIQVLNPPKKWYHEIKTSSMQLFHQECCYLHNTLHFFLPPLLFKLQEFVQYSFVGLSVSVHGGGWNKIKIVYLKIRSICHTVS